MTKMRDKIRDKIVELIGKKVYILDFPFGITIMVGSCDFRDETLHQVIKDVGYDYFVYHSPLDQYELKETICAIDFVKKIV